jgi:chloramphenicol-sensitive protein RarD
MSPLMSVFIGYLVLKERMRPLQWVAVCWRWVRCWLTWPTAACRGSLLIALTFAFYGLCARPPTWGAGRPVAGNPADAAPGIDHAGFRYLHDSNAFTHASTTAKVLLALSGPITAVPLLLFAHGARRIPLSMLGLMQYISPTIQLLGGVIYGEPFRPSRHRLCVIWVALAVYSAEGLWRYMRARGFGEPTPAAPEGCAYRFFPDWHLLILPWPNTSLP